MGKYAYVKLSIILYHKSTDLSIWFMKFLKNIFQKLFLRLMGNRFFRLPIYCSMILILRQATFRNGDAYSHLLAAAKNFECNDVTYTHVEHHIDDMVLTGDLGDFAV